MLWYLYCEDFAAAVVGPFDDRESAEDHIRYCERRGDGATMQVVTEQEAHDLADEHPNCVWMTPTEDRAVVMPLLPEGDVDHTEEDARAYREEIVRRVRPSDY